MAPETQVALHREACVSACVSARVSARVSGGMCTSDCLVTLLWPLKKVGDDLTFFYLLAYSLFLPLQSLIKSSWPPGVLAPYAASHALCPLKE